jgi:hypothetical protein
MIDAILNIPIPIKVNIAHLPDFQQENYEIGFAHFHSATVAGILRMPSAVFVRSWQIGYGTGNVPTTFVGVQPSGCPENRQKPGLQRGIPELPPSPPELFNRRSSFGPTIHIGGFDAGVLST